MNFKSIMKCADVTIVINIYIAKITVLLTYKSYIYIYSMSSLPGWIMLNTAASLEYILVLSGRVCHNIVGTFSLSISFSV